MGDKNGACRSCRGISHLVHPCRDEREPKQGLQRKLRRPCQVRVARFNASCRLTHQSCCEAPEQEHSLCKSWYPDILVSAMLTSKLISAGHAWAQLPSQML